MSKLVVLVLLLLVVNSVLVVGFGRVTERDEKSSQQELPSGTQGTQQEISAVKDYQDLLH